MTEDRLLATTALEPPTASDPTAFLSIGEAAAAHPEASVVAIGVDGAHVGFVAARALDAGRHLFISSGGVPREDEIALKRRARELGLLVMGPDCSTAILAGVGLGYANRVPRGPVGVVGTSGSAIQELICSLAHLGVGISHAIGSGSHDLEPDVNGAMTEAGLRLLAADSDTRVLVLVAGRAGEDQRRAVAELCAGLSKPVVVRFLGASARGAEPGLVAADLDDAARMAAALARNVAPVARLPALDVGSRAAALLGKRPRLEGRLVGLFAGGSLATEALVILREAGVDAALACRPLAPEGRVEEEGNLLVDLGADFYTAIGAPHPLVDQRLRCGLLEKVAADPAVGVLLLDVPLGDGAHLDPAPELAAAIARGRRRRGEDPLIVVASICGTDADPQHAGRQRSVLVESGVQVTLSGASAARLCAAVKTGARGGLT